MNATKVKSTRQLRREKGLCVDCSTPSVTRRCKECTRKAYNFRLTRKANGLCIECGATSPQRTRCVECQDRRNQTAKQVNEQNRNIVLEHYGKRCNCCGETETAFLTLDHLNGRTKHDDFTGTRLYRFVIRNNFPFDYQVLCANCNWAKFVLGVCPHAKTKAKV